VSELPECVRGACIHTNMTPQQRRSVMESVVVVVVVFVVVLCVVVACDGCR